MKVWEDDLFIWLMGSGLTWFLHMFNVREALGVVDFTSKSWLTPPLFWSVGWWPSNLPKSGKFRVYGICLHVHWIYPPNHRFFSCPVIKITFVGHLVLLDNPYSNWTGHIPVQTLFSNQCFTAPLATTYPVCAGPNDDSRKHSKIALRV